MLASCVVGYCWVVMIQLGYNFSFVRAWNNELGLPVFSSGL
jgi:hypothetical protein